MPRAALPPECVREIGIRLNGGKINGWTARVGALLGVPTLAVQRWSAPVGAASSRAIPGPAARLLLAYAALERSGVPAESLAAMIAREGQR